MSAGVAISGFEELLKLSSGGEMIAIVDADGTTKKMQASVLCWELVELMCGTDPYFRNSIYRGKDLTDVYTPDELHEKVSSGDFSDLYIGDYIYSEITTSYGGTEKVQNMFAHFDYFMQAGSTQITDHHIVMVPKDSFATLAAMNDSNTTEGGYYASAMHTTVLPVYYTALNSALGGHILTHSRYLTTTVNTTATSAAGCNLTGSATACSWYGTNLCLMSEAMLYGGAVFSSSGRDISDACIQLALFALAPNFRCAYQGCNSGTRYAFWLCGVASSTYFCLCSGDGVAYSSGASSSLGVRPYFLFA